MWNARGQLTLWNDRLHFGSPNVQLAALGDFTFNNLPGASNPAYLAAADEVLLTQPIKDQAALLNHDPVQIYHWVRNNIEWQPTWGAVQNAELTLDARRGNAMDIASLTLALLRASQIPARYVHGTIEIPEAEFRNWVGGFSSIEAATNYSASGGIPTGGVVNAGKIESVQIEHIWVEVAADYFPSRVAK
ncbi:MAG TPA: transglutaminase domain-containing protein, partial [Gammaproteobacteria bacterium]|nr:transglutaminase domain-containing protein [Gammaproteobacteria bacterium]